MALDLTGVRLSYATTTGEASGFARLATGLSDHGPDGTLLAELRLPGGAMEVEWLHPFSWDHGDRGVITATRRLDPGDRLCLHAGPYGTADAAAHRDGVPMAFPLVGEGHRYLPDSVPPPRPDDVHQDAAGWVVARVGDRYLCLGWEYSGHLIMTAEVTASEAVITTLLPADTFAPAPDGRTGPGPTGWLSVGPGDLDAGAAALRRLITTEMITRPDLSGLPGEPAFPCLVANSWGVQENTSTARILAMMEATAAVGAEVFVVDKGWERSVGDWHANDRFPSGLAALAQEARRRGMGFGLWCGWGNADPRSPVALEHPDWLTTWRGHIPVLSFDNHALCLGHEPARDWVLGELTRMITDDDLDWLLHDFETIARCDSDRHTHDPGAGEHAAEAAFHHILRALGARFPLLVLENCWNGVRPLDLAMIRSHHTTITEDHCRTHPNSLAKVGLGRYLPLDWQSTYMGADDRGPGPLRPVRDRRAVGADGRPGDVDPAEPDRAGPGGRGLPALAQRAARRLGQSPCRLTGRGRHRAGRRRGRLRPARGQRRRRDGRRAVERDGGLRSGRASPGARRVVGRGGRTRPRRLSPVDRPGRRRCAGQPGPGHDNAYAVKPLRSSPSRLPRCSTTRWSSSTAPTRKLVNGSEQRLPLRSTAPTPRRASSEHQT